MKAAINKEARLSDEYHQQSKTGQQTAACLNSRGSTSVSCLLDRQHENTDLSAVAVRKHRTACVCQVIMPYVLEAGVGAVRKHCECTVLPARTAKSAEALTPHLQRPQQETTLCDADRNILRLPWTHACRCIKPKQLGNHDLSYLVYPTNRPVHWQRILSTATNRAIPCMCAGLLRTSHQPMKHRRAYREYCSMPTKLVHVPCGISMRTHSVSCHRLRILSQGIAHCAQGNADTIPLSDPETLKDFGHFWGGGGMHRT